MEAESHPASPGGGSQDSCDSAPSPLNIPIGNISRIMKKALPAGAKITRNAKETVQDCVKEFILFVASEANEVCKTDKRKVINVDDLLTAMSSLGFEDYIEPLKIYLTRYREFDTKGSAAEDGESSSTRDVPPNPNDEVEDMVVDM